MPTFTTITDLSEALADTMQLDVAAVRWALWAHRALWGRYEDITPVQYAALSAAVWADVTGEPYPGEWTDADHERIQQEGARDARESPDAQLLRAAIAASGLSVRQFAARTLARDPRTIFRWLAGQAMPRYAREACERIVTDASTPGAPAAPAR